MRPEFYVLTRLGQLVMEIETSAKRNYFIVNKIVNIKKQRRFDGHFQVEK